MTPAVKTNRFCNLFCWAVILLSRSSVDDPTDVMKMTVTAITIWFCVAPGLVAAD